MPVLVAAHRGSRRWRFPFDVGVHVSKTADGVAETLCQLFLEPSHAAGFDSGGELSSETSAGIDGTVDVRVVGLAAPDEAE